jgi:hypothetical protein
MRRIVPYIVLLGAVGLLAGFAWFTQHPDTPWMEKAQEWALVGRLAAALRQAYLGPAASGAPEAAQGEGAPAGETTARRPRRRPAPPPEPPRAVEEPIHLPASARPAARETPSSRDAPSGEGGTGGPVPAPEATAKPPPRPRPPTRRSPPIQYLAEEWVWFLPGQRIRSAAAAEAPEQALLEALAWLPVLRRSGVWAEVVYRGEKGWIDTSWQPPHRRRGAKRGLLRHRYEPVQGSDPWRLEKARKVLGIDRPAVKVGAYDLYTDVEDETLLDFLDSAAVAAEEAYFARYARLPSGDPLRSAILFARERDYRRFSESANLASDVHVGYAGRGILTFYAEGQPRQELARTLVHEIGHLLNDRAVAWQLPPWLEEGMATDLGSVWVEGSRLVESPLGSGARWSLEIQAPEGRFLILGEALENGRLPPLGVLLTLDRETFYQADVISYAYAHSFAFIRYLLDGEQGRHAEAFRGFLKRIASGRGADLLKLLETDLDELDRGFRTWLEAEVERHRGRLEKRASELVQDYRSTQRGAPSAADPPSP